MREPRAEDDEVMSTVDLMVRLSTSTRIVDVFVAEAEARRDADSWFHAGLAAWSLMDVTAHSLRKHGLLMSALNHLSAAVQVDPEHWPGRFMRATYITMLHSEEADEMVAFLLPATYAITSARQDAQTLVDLQERNGLSAPYGLAAYCLAAVQASMAGDEAAARQALQSGLTVTRDGPAPAMSSKIVIPVVMALRRPQTLAGTPLRAELAKRCRSLATVSELVE